MRKPRLLQGGDQALPELVESQLVGLGDDQVDAASVPDPVSKRKNPRIGPIKLAPAKPIPPATSAGDELKDEPNFGSASDPSRGPR